jgi:hypothetical protein
VARLRRAGVVVEGGQTAELGRAAGGAAQVEAGRRRANLTRSCSSSSSRLWWRSRSASAAPLASACRRGAGTAGISAGGRGASAKQGRRRRWPAKRRRRPLARSCAAHPGGADVLDRVVQGLRQLPAALPPPDALQVAQVRRALGRLRQAKAGMGAGGARRWAAAPAHKRVGPVAPACCAHLVERPDRLAGGHGQVVVDGEGGQLGQEADQPAGEEGGACVLGFGWRAAPRASCWAPCIILPLLQQPGSRSRRRDPLDAAG